MIIDELNYNLINGEFSETQVMEILFNGNSYMVNGIISKKYNRKEVDGRYATDIPLYTLMVMISLSSIPTEISQDDLKNVLIKIQDKIYTVIFITGTDFLTFTLRPIDEHEEII